MEPPHQSEHIGQIDEGLMEWIEGLIVKTEKIYLITLMLWIGTGLKVERTFDIVLAGSV